MRSLTKAGEPQTLEHPLIGTEKSPIETIDVISDDQSQYDFWEGYCDFVIALEKRADNPTFPVEDHSPELIALRKEVSKLAKTGRIYLRLAYIKYLTALGFSVEDANFLADNLDGPCRSNIFEKVNRAEGVLDIKTTLIMCL